MKYNDLDLEKWKEIDINVDSLWLINERDKSGKHTNIYHGNFIPQIPNQLIRRFTKKNEIVFEPFMGSGTTLFECENLHRKYIGFDINPEMINYVNTKMNNDIFYKDYYYSLCDVTKNIKVKKEIKAAFDKFKTYNFHFILMHPPYLDIIKFTNNKNDLSNIKDISLFKKKFIQVCKNCLPYLEDGRYFALVIGDIYKNREVIPLSFYLFNSIKENFEVKLKGIIIKNIEGNRGKLGKGGIWRYRALKSDYYLFKHEYIFVFKKG
ncbi:MAG: hypothetical protein PWQ09_395 [Candidatus Cloacimonadota bacterium]|jgi:DNA modification methylase|nr:hypothetical protein [Candidatus Cloacimonadota bacterium]